MAGNDAGIAAPSQTNSAQQLLTLGSLMAGLLMFLFTPWLVRKLPGSDWWIEYAPIWDAPYRLDRQSYEPYCPEGHACFFLIGIQIIALCLIHGFLHRKLSEEAAEGGDSLDYSAYSRQRQERHSHRRQRGR